MSIEPIKPRLIAFEVTRRCRFNCRHCRANAGCAGGEELTTEQCKRILASVAQFNKCVIIVTGGEPMERPDVCEIIRYGRDVGLRMVMATCGYALNEKSLAELKTAGITALSFSLDGATAEIHDAFRRSRGAFEAVLRAAHLARDAGVRFQINTTITRTNLPEVGRIAALAQQLGAYCFNPFILVPTGRGQAIAGELLGPAEYEKLLEELLELKLNLPIELRVTCGPQFTRICRQAKIIKDQSSIGHGCMGGKGFGFISWRGDVQTCGFLDIPAGNLVQNGFDFAAIWTQSPFLAQIRNTSGYKGECGICKYVKVCGGCRARAYAMTGDYLATDPLCGFKPPR